MLVIHQSSSYNRERKYIYDVIFCEYFGIDYRIVLENRHNVCITLCDNDKKIIIADGLFNTSEKDWLTVLSLPIQPLPIWQVEKPEIKCLLTEDSLPVIFGKLLSTDMYLSCKENEIQLGIDVFGSAFFMLTRYEEMIKTDRDNHNRFPAKASLAFQERFIERPIINEYLEILWWAIKHLCPTLKRKKRQFKIIPTHDVDSPFDVLLLSPYRLLHSLAGDVIKRKSLKTFMDRATNAYKVKMGNVFEDRYYTFEFIMNISEKYNLTSCFYMMEAQGLSNIDGNYPLDNPDIINLMRSISSRGHEVGLHLSYMSYNDGQEVKRETQRLFVICQNAGIEHLQMGGRQHYLRWQCPDTWQHYEDAGLVYDTSLSYPDHIGFRCGVCFEYSVFNLKTRQSLKLKERPLIMMECSMLDEKYMNLSTEDAYQRVIKLKNICKKYDGDFVLLWHNTRLIDEKEKNLYCRVISS